MPSAWLDGAFFVRLILIFALCRKQAFRQYRLIKAVQLKKLSEIKLSLSRCFRFVLLERAERL